jgi:hypothetical protein
MGPMGGDVTSEPQVLRLASLAQDDIAVGVGDAIDCFCFDRWSAVVSHSLRNYGAKNGAPGAVVASTNSRSFDCVIALQ